MSGTLARSLPEKAAARPLGARLAVALLAALAVAGLGALLVWLLFPPAPPPRPVPFGLGMREAAPEASGLGAILLSFQAVFYGGLREAVSNLRESWSALGTLAGLGFAYGVFHAAGPGHGKAVIAAYLVADGRALGRGFTLSTAAALLQALVAILVVGAASILLSATARQMEQATGAIELASFAAVAAIGAVVLWRKAGAFVALWSFARSPGAPVQNADACCDHIPGPEAISRIASLREAAGVVVAAGLRPCAGAIIVLVFSLSQGLFWAGVAATFAMALGTALTTGLIASLGVFAKRLALRLVGGRGTGGTLALAGLEVLAAATVLVVGAALLVGLARASGL